MSERYEIEYDDLVQLLALVCAHGILGERKEDEAADELLDRSNAILERTGVRDVEELTIEVGAALNRLVPEPEPETFPDGAPEDPYLWESGT